MSSAALVICALKVKVVTSFFSVRISSKSDGLKPSSVLPCPSDEPCSPLLGDKLGLPGSDFWVCNQYGLNICS